MKTRITYSLTTGIFLLGLLTGCNSEYVPEAETCPDHNYLAIEGEIVGASLATRAGTDPLGSYNHFEFGDRIGFYSFHKPGCTLGSRQEHQQQGDDPVYLRNECLEYSNATGTPKFISEKIKDVAMNTLGQTFAYFPYSAETVPEGYVKQNGDGFESLTQHEHYIHIFDANNQVVDLLTATKRLYYDVNYEFRHQFSMVLLFLGNGFDEAKNEEYLTVHLTERIIGAHLTRKWLNSAYPEGLEFSVDRVPLDYSPSGFGYSSFKAIKRDPYDLGSGEPRTAYSIILPYGSEIDYIELKDKNDNIQKVKPTALAELEAGWIYPATIRMDDGLEPTVYPHEIIPWGDPTEIKVNSLPGIYDTDDFKAWLKLYNEHFDKLNEIDESVHESFEEYGDYDQDEKKWNFYLRDNIDCTGIESTDGTLIKKLVNGVRIYGGRYRLENLMLDLGSAEPKTGMGLFGEIAGGELHDLRLYFPTVRYNGDKPAGCLAAVISGGVIDNCTVREAAMMCAGTAGALAGQMTGGMVNECKFHGLVQAARPEDITLAYLGIFGAVPEVVEGNIINIINNVNFVDFDLPNP